jgi:hypothetical protein
MRTRVFVLLGLAASAALVACGPDHHGYGYGSGSGIVFGISQSIDPASGETTTRAGYEYLELARKGGWATTIADAGDGVCIFEELDRRVGRPHVGDGGRARFSGGSLPREGLIVNANEEEPRHAGAAFEPAGALVFDVDHGFGLPNISPIALPAPRTQLEVLAPEPGELALDPSVDLGFEWDALVDILDHPSRVMVALETEEPDGRGKEVRCFYDDADGRGVIPSRFISQLGGSGTKGVVQVATHRQVNIYARGGWTVYVVGAVYHREQPFMLD